MTGNGDHSEEEQAMADDDNDSGDDSSDETPGRGEEVGGGGGEGTEVKERSDDQDAPLPGAPPGPRRPPAELHLELTGWRRIGR